MKSRRCRSPPSSRRRSSPALPACSSAWRRPHRRCAAGANTENIRKYHHHELSDLRPAQGDGQEAALTALTYQLLDQNLSPAPRATTRWYAQRGVNGSPPRQAPGQTGAAGQEGHKRNPPGRDGPPRRRQGANRPPAPGGGDWPKPKASPLHHFPRHHPRGPRRIDLFFLAWLSWCCSTTAGLTSARPVADAVRVVTGLSPTSTMRAAPCSSTWVSRPCGSPIRTPRRACGWRPSRRPGSRSCRRAPR